ncbi:MAG: GNAT family N-acetyltransferase [Candidatus Micrarchaeota archaeon]|nr:GNAT family N-acetyltransferase [Candidatus Micrarchaeota archaeon]MDE1824196.1 GNAT family N-acetyltransferase [Candidatus Micrarchaeota archaeon]MDE1850142.1 GNAT family N-acetyltransferase [Candidatus Micrarchaeota archaeon]
MKEYKFRIRTLKRTDFKGLVKNYFTYYEEVKKNPNLGITLFKPRPSMKMESRWFEDLYNQKVKGTKVVVIAEVDGKPMGICEVTTKRPHSEMDHVGILGIAIHQKHRSKGIGSALMKEAIKRSKGRFELIVLEVFSNNKKAINLYKKFGFKSYGTLPGSVKRGNRRIGSNMMYLRVR